MENGKAGEDDVKVNGVTEKAEAVAGSSSEPAGADKPVSLHIYTLYFTTFLGAFIGRYSVCINLI